MKTIRLATRKSPLALVQARYVAASIREYHPELEIEEVLVSTEGDRVIDRPLAEVGGKGLFVKEVQAAVLRGDADFAVHSLKDLPGDLPSPSGLSILCFPKREDAHDVLVTRDGIDFASLPKGAKVGTASLRRVCQLRRRRPDIHFVGVRGNIGTRMAKVAEGHIDAVVLAQAGIRRLQGNDEPPCVPIPMDTCLPAAGQGTLAIEAREGDEALAQILASIDHADTRAVTIAERSFLKEIGGNCHSPIAAYAKLEGGLLSLDALVLSVDGYELLQASSESYVGCNDMASEASTLGIAVAKALHEQGAKKLIQRAEQQAGAQAVYGNGGGPKVLWSWKKP